MYAERQARYPKGTYKVLLSRESGSAEYFMVNLFTGHHSNALSTWNLIKSIESDLSSNRFPQNSIQYRTWGLAADSKHDDEKVVNINAKARPLPEKYDLTFIIKVLYRQNATWQGTIQWIEGRQTRQYRSVNELLKLMDEAAEFTPHGEQGMEA